MMSLGSPWFSAVGRALLLASRLNRYTTDVKDAAAVKRLAGIGLLAAGVSVALT